MCSIASGIVGNLSGGAEIPNMADASNNRDVAGRMRGALGDGREAAGCSNDVRWQGQADRQTRRQTGKQTDMQTFFAESVQTLCRLAKSHTFWY